MREICMPFNASMAGAIWEGRKTQTRRPMKRNFPVMAEGGGYEWTPDGKGYFHGGGWASSIIDNIPSGWLSDFCPYAPGDVLCVRETARVIEVRGGSREITIQYLADNSIRTVEYPARLAPAPKIGHCLPNGTYREACRSRCKILSVRIERIQNITDANIEEEGIVRKTHIPNIELWGIPWTSHSVPTRRSAFIDLWNMCYPGSWERNDWVWRIAFEKVEGVR